MDRFPRRVSLNSSLNASWPSYRAVQDLATFVTEAPTLPPPDAAIEQKNGNKIASETEFVSISFHFLRI